MNLENEDALAASQFIDLRSIRSAPALAGNGRQDLALLTLQAASERLLDHSFLEDDFFAFEREESITALESVLRRAASETRYEIPRDAFAFGFRNRMYFHVPSSAALFRVDNSLEPVQMASLPGRVVGLYDLLPPVGAVLAIETADQLSFRKFDPDAGLGETLLVLPRQSEPGEWEIAMGADGVALIRERLPEDVLRKIPERKPVAFLARLDASEMETLTDADLFVLGTGADGVSYLATNGEVSFGEGAWLGVEVRTSMGAIELGFDYTQCLASNAQDSRANLYGEVIRFLAGSANSIRCELHGGFMAVSAETYTTRGSTDRLHLVDLQDWAEGQQQRTEILTPHLYAEGFSLFASAETRVADLVHFSGTLLSLSTSHGQTLELRFPTRIETVVALGHGRAAITLSPRPGNVDDKILSIVDFHASDRWGRVPLPLSDLPHDRASEIGQEYDLRSSVEPLRQACLSLNDRVNAQQALSETASSTADVHPVVLPQALRGVESCLKISPSGEYAAIWDAGSLHVLQAQTGEVLAEYGMATEPRDFVFSECCEPALLIADANAIVYRGLPRLTTYLDERGSAVDVRYSEDDQEATVLLFAEGPILGMELSPSDSRLLYTLATSAGTLETRLHSLISGASLATLGESANFQESYFINDDAVYYWDPSRAFIYETLSLDEAPILINESLSAYCHHEEDQEIRPNCM